MFSGLLVAHDNANAKKRHAKVLQDDQGRASPAAPSVDTTPPPPPPPGPPLPPPPSSRTTTTVFPHSYAPPQPRATTAT